jgi:hypothetical protein
VLGRTSSWDGADPHEIALEEERLRFVPPQDRRGDSLAEVSSTPSTPRPRHGSARERGLSQNGTRASRSAASASRLV